MSPRKKGTTYGRYSRELELFLVLLRFEQGVDFHTIKEYVEEYQVLFDKNEKSAMRLFQHDKVQLQQAGCEITVVPNDEGILKNYRLDRDRTFLYFTLSGSGPTAPFPDITPEEAKCVITLLQRAVIRLNAMGLGAAAAAAGRVLHKLAAPVARDTLQYETAIERIAHRRESGALMTLIEAMESRKQVTFSYQTPYTGQTRRTVYPYGIYPQNGQLYLVTYDLLRQQQRTFRIDRIHRPKLNRRKSQTPDYRLPEGFDIHACAVPRNPWEMSSGSPRTVTIRLQACNGATLPEAKRGLAMDTEQLRWAFTVRDLDIFTRWVLAFAGEMSVESPSTPLKAWQALAKETLALYSREPSPAIVNARPASMRKSRRSEQLLVSSADQLTRLLVMVQLFADGTPHSVQAIADRMGVAPRQVKHDLLVLSRRPADARGVEFTFSVLPGEDSDDIWEIDVNPDVFQDLRKPLMLTALEVGTMETGLMLLGDELLPSEREPWMLAMQLIRSYRREPDRRAVEAPMAIAEQTGGDLRRDPRIEHNTVRLMEAIQQHQVVTLHYMARQATRPSPRDVHPYRLIDQVGLVYLEAWCVRDGKWKLYLLDRMYGIESRGDTFKRDPDYRPSNDQWQKTLAKAPQQLVVRYTGQAARLEAEHEGVGVEADGSLTWRYPLADEAWGIRKVLQYGPEAEALAPESVREGIRTRLRIVLGEA